MTYIINLKIYYIQVTEKNFFYVALIREAAKKSSFFYRQSTKRGGGGGKGLSMKEFFFFKFIVVLLTTTGPIGLFTKKITVFFGFPRLITHFSNFISFSRYLKDMHFLKIT